MDSYEKFACDLFGSLDPSFARHVLDIDKSEVVVQFATVVCGLEYSDNYRIYPMSMKREYYELRNRGCCGFFDSMVTCKSGNQYLIGCNYGH